MSDVALVGIITGIITAVAALTGAGLSAWVNYKVTKHQAKTRREDLKQQLQHDQEEAKKDRLVEVRKGHLLLLREGMSNSYSYCLNLRLNAMRLEFLKANGLPTDTFISAMSHDPRNLVTNFTEMLSPLIGEIADRTLYDLASSYHGHLLNLSSRIIQAINASSDPASLLDDDITEPATNGMLAVNRRIEELLSGEPALPQEGSPGPSQSGSH